MRLNTVPVGIFSANTMRDEDIGNAIADLLRPLRLSKSDRQLIRDWDKALAKDEEARTDEEDLGMLCSELWTSLDEYLPPYTYSGSLEGDGACFGVWPDIDSVLEDLRNGDIINHAGLTTNYSGLSVDISDHGNMTLYSISLRGKVREVWSVV